jgi:hypothetical protein
MSKVTPFFVNVAVAVIPGRGQEPDRRELFAVTDDGRVMEWTGEEWCEVAPSRSPDSGNTPEPSQGQHTPDGNVDRATYLKSLFERRRARMRKANR